MFLNLKHSCLKSISVNQVKILTNYNLYFPITEEGKSICFHINHPVFKETGLFFSSMCSELLSVVLLQASTPMLYLHPVSVLWTEDISLDPLGPQDRLPEPPFVTDSCIEEKYNLAFHCYLENSCFQSTNHLTKQ